MSRAGSGCFSVQSTTKPKPERTDDMSSKNKKIELKDLSARKEVKGGGWRTRGAGKKHQS
jgi:hypothetical protein